ncbi:uncharacterized protein LOC110665661 isoform X1 [Hevea brasiliensis]|uniref:uncharacterized protein LOC110665661 isoform X1 n=1 Tax=Hevea brasiliensis TaxID=3981 RepID=UPI0025D25257|nr:uncharacterized protein LOC110665661 isoform X1 [Hevea brasiliensis]
MVKGRAPYGRPDSYVAEAEHPYKSSKVETRWQWNRDAQNLPSHMPLHSFTEGQGRNSARSFYQGQAPGPKLGSENPAKDGSTQPYEQDMEIGYEDSTLPPTFEGLEQKFLDEITRLGQEQIDAEDAENTRHREKIIEINYWYQDKLSELRTQQANQRKVFLRKESQARLNQYQQAGMSHFSNTGVGSNSGAPATGSTNVRRAYTTNQFGSYRAPPQFVGRRRNPGTKRRVPYRKGRVYNNAGAHYR